MDCSYGPAPQIRTLWTLVDWASKPENAKAWEELMSASGGQLTDNPFKDVNANFAFGDAAFIKVQSMNMNKAKRLGWTGFVDTMEVSTRRLTCAFPMTDLESRLFSRCIMKLESLE